MYSDKFSYLFWLIPLWWLIGIKPFIFHIFFIPYFFYLLIGVRKTKKESILLFLKTLILFYCFAIILNLPQMPLSRGVGTVSNLMVWVMGLSIVNLIVAGELRYQDIIRTSRAILFVTIFSSGLMIFGWIEVFFGNYNVVLYSPALLFYPDAITSSSEIIKDALQIVIVRADDTYFGLLPRSAGFFEYPNALALGAIASFPLVFIPEVVKKKTMRIVYAILLILTLLGSGSRMTLAGSIAVILSSYLFLQYYRSSRFSWQRVIMISAIVFTGILVVIVLPEIYLISQSYRPGSVRDSLIIEAINMLFEKGNIIFGLGFKPRDDLFYHPVGSHSTFFGTFLKIGVAGLILLIAMWIVIMKRWFTSIQISATILREKYILVIGNCVIIGIFWQFVEDIDAPATASSMYFFLIGVLFFFTDKYSQINYGKV